MKIVGRVLDEIHSNMKQNLDLSFYKYIPQGYFYQPTEFTIFLINTSHRNTKFETVTLSNIPNSIEMDKFVYFLILKTFHYLLILISLKIKL